MAAISHVFTIRRAAQILGRDEDLLWHLSDQLEPEDGKLRVRDIDGAEPPRLHARLHRGSSRNYQGSDRSRRLSSRRVYRGAQRMLTCNLTVSTAGKSAQERSEWDDRFMRRVWLRLSSSSRAGADRVFGYCDR